MGLGKEGLARARLARYPALFLRNRIEFRPREVTKVILRLTHALSRKPKCRVGP